MGMAGYCATKLPKGEVPSGEVKVKKLTVAADVDMQV
jgi:hypothetical protein